MGHSGHKRKVFEQPRSPPERGCARRVSRSNTQIEITFGHLRPPACHSAAVGLRPSHKTRAVVLHATPRKNGKELASTFACGLPIPFGRGEGRGEGLPGAPVTQPSKPYASFLPPSPFPVPLPSTPLRKSAVIRTAEDLQFPPSSILHPRFSSGPHLHLFIFPHSG